MGEDSVKMCQDVEIVCLRIIKQDRILLFTRNEVQENPYLGHNWADETMSHTHTQPACTDEEVFFAVHYWLGALIDFSQGSKCE